MRKSSWLLLWQAYFVWKFFLNNSSCQPSNPPVFPSVFHLSQPFSSHTVTCPLRQLSLPTGNILWHDLICGIQGHLGWQLSNNIVHSAFLPFFLLSPSDISSTFLFPPTDQSIRKKSFKNTIISETSVVGNQLTFTSSLSPRPRTWMWLRRWSAWCWKSSTLACATLYTTIPTWCMRCSTRGSFSSSSGHTLPSRTSCRTWTRSVCFFPAKLHPNIRN